MIMRNMHRATVIASIAVAFALAASACAAPSNPIDSSGVPLGDVALDPTASLNVSPVDYNGIGVIVASFGTASSGRVVSLQRRTGSSWSEVASGAEDATGQVQFEVKDSPGTFRAVAAETTSGGADKPAVATVATSAEDQWKEQLSTEFSGQELDSKFWVDRSSGNYGASGRHCSAAYPSNVAVANDKVALTVTEETDKANIAKAKAAGCKAAGVYRSGMISTEGLVKVNTGLVAARVKFAEGQGIHGGVWLQSYGKSEIDLIESYGYGQGLTSIVHVGGKQYPPTPSETYVNTELVKDQQWWDGYHVCSVEWDSTELVFRIDGVITKKMARTAPDLAYFVVISMLSSDWEQDRFAHPAQGAPGVRPASLPQSMSVDWLRVWTRA